MSQNNSLTLSQQKLMTFLACQRRFYLRYRARLPWPERPLPAEQETAVSLGHQFHQLLERHFLGLPVDTTQLENGRLHQWWSQFQTHPPPLPAGLRLPEVGLTVPLPSTNQPAADEPGPLLVGRFDLVVLGQTEAGEPAIHMYDWKTGRPQSVADLRHSWQTRLYLALAAEGGGALFHRQNLDMGSRALSPAAIRLTYWYVHAPDEPRTIGYSQAEHEQTWAELTAVSAQIEAGIVAETAVSVTPTDLPATLWPKTDEWATCTFCAYQAYCGRHKPATDAPLPTPEEDDDPTETAVWATDPHPV